VRNVSFRLAKCFSPFSGAFGFAGARDEMSRVSRPARANRSPVIARSAPARCGDPGSPSPSDEPWMASSPAPRNDERGSWAGAIRRRGAQKVAPKRSQAAEIVGTRSFVRAPRFITARSLRWVRPPPAPGRLQDRGHPSRSARAPKGLRPSPGVRPARASARH
jgi:hypothetical protein